MPLKHAHMGVGRTAARCPLNTWQPDHIFADLEQTCHLNMPTWAWAEQLHAPRWIPDSQITCIYAGFNQKCQNEREQNSCALLALTARSRLFGFPANMPLKHANMGVSRTAAPSPSWQLDHVCAGFEQTCQHMGVSRTAAPSCWIADSQITSMQIWNEHAT